MIVDQQTALALQKRDDDGGGDDDGADSQPSWTRLLDGDRRHLGRTLVVTAATFPVTVAKPHSESANGTQQTGDDHQVLLLLLLPLMAVVEPWTIPSSPIQGMDTASGGVPLWKDDTFATEEVGQLPTQ